MEEVPLHAVKTEEAWPNDRDIGGKKVNSIVRYKKTLEGGLITRFARRRVTRSKQRGPGRSVRKGSWLWQESGVKERVESPKTKDPPRAGHRTSVE